ncbi:hypothetical protein CQ017_05130 [Arthrobacter sp. MYb224]|uniref:hypothetical protein n=1 Tax=Micrococcaceae TaxID=1268 RepID=UPI000CFD64D1|nr:MULTISPECIES: hypothetical protein [unclassified Arthrobacter]PRA00409.1 hypothetical protein CQ017_05130 [Arthrobacter sp. MYb224]PRA04601.1 hypothetical protein CQ019_09825 [Arthrobacter sp. MYb229]PRB51487.1 hypothetical protein CQ013_06740 [Arthrobacter sp. MYb216]
MDPKNKSSKTLCALRYLLSIVVLAVSTAHVLAAFQGPKSMFLAMSAMGVLCLVCLPHLVSATCEIEKSTLQVMLMSAAMAVAHLLWISMSGHQGHGQAHGHVADRLSPLAADAAGQHSATMLGLIALELATLAVASIVLRASRALRNQPALPVN